MAEGQTLVRDIPESDDNAPLVWGEGDSINYEGAVENATLATQRAEAIPPTLQTMLDGLSDVVALVSYDGTILATNARWDRAIERAEVPRLAREGNYFEFISELVETGDPNGAPLLRGLSEICQGRRNRFTHVFIGGGRYEGQHYKVILSRFAFGGQQMILVSAHDIAELIRLRQQRKRLGSRLLKAQEDERRRVARDLHDSTAQLLVGLQFSLSRLKQVDPGTAPEGLLADCSEAVERVQREIRAFSFICHPPSLETEGLVLALEGMVRGFAQRAGLEVEVMIGDPGEISHSAEATIFRLTQEVLASVHRHSEAEKLAVWLVGTERHVHLVIKDDGHGFSPTDLDSSVPLGVGISGMKERLAHLGGRLTIHQLPRGTSLIATLPRADTK